MNIKYKSDEIARFYTEHRNTWSDFYQSERWILKRVFGEDGRLKSVLDVGCAAGGLGRALAERFSLAKYVGVDINQQVIQTALATQDTFPVPCRFECADIADPDCLAGQQFDLVCSFSCADWNVETTAIMNACWERVRPGGYFVISLRLTPERGVNDMSRSYQYIHFGSAQPTSQEEKANYVVFNWRDALVTFASLSPLPGHILGYGYWGKPSFTAVTFYDSLVFAVFALHKTEIDDKETRLELHLPANLLISQKRDKRC